jgi:hypothetical protein
MWLRLLAWRDGAWRRKPAVGAADLWCQVPRPAGCGDAWMAVLGSALAVGELRVVRRNGCDCGLR